MPQANIFRWRSGRGWMVLSGGGAWDSEDITTIEAQLLLRTLSQGPIVYLWAAGDIETADAHMDSLRDLGARTGYLADILTEEDDVLFKQISEAGVIILGDGPNQTLLGEALSGVVLRGIDEAMSQGATVYAVGASAALLGMYQVADGELAAGLDWLKQAIIVPGFHPDDSESLRQWVFAYPEGYGLGLGDGAALALGPEGEVEVWGSAQITVLLGSKYQPGGA